mmetsp:Transcript_913/g.1840  ORF Transcript_913/g.1840 Transcript_913/m.1840 type:complete len:429 (+) Transcript_913:514-1800(+)
MDKPSASVLDTRLDEARREYKEGLAKQRDGAHLHAAHLLFVRAACACLPEALNKVGVLLLQNALDVDPVEVRNEVEAEGGACSLPSHLDFASGEALLRLAADEGGYGPAQYNLACLLERRCGRTFADFCDPPPLSPPSPRFHLYLPPSPVSDAAAVDEWAGEVRKKGKERKRKEEGEEEWEGEMVGGMMPSRSEGDDTTDLQLRSSLLHASEEGKGEREEREEREGKEGKESEKRTSAMVEALKYVKKAARRHVAEAQMKLAHLYSFGAAQLGVEKSEDLALEWALRAASNGHGPAYLHLARLYDAGSEKVKRDPSKAVQYAQQAANKGMSEGHCLLGYLHSTGRASEGKGGGRGKRNMKKAVEYYTKAVELGSGPAAFNLALRYERGEGVKADLSQAYRMAKLAVQRGVDEAKDKLAELSLVEGYEV